MKRWKRAVACMMSACMCMSNVAMMNVHAEDAVSAEQGWEELSGMLDAAAGQWLNPDFKDAVTKVLPSTALMGNGDIGVTSAGSKTEKSYLISKGDFWSCGWLGEKDTAAFANRKTKVITVGGVTIKQREEEEEVVNKSLTQGENVTVTASSHLNSSRPNEYFLPEYVIDGVITKDNVPGEGWTSEVDAKDSEKWIQIDLGEEKTIAKYIVYHAQSVFGDRPHQNTKDFTMQYSLDGTDWTTCDDVKGNTEAKTVKVFEEPIQARYVKMQISEASQQPAETRARIAEIELFADANDRSIFDPVEEEGNRSLTQGEDVTVTASSHLNSSRPNEYFLPEYVIDGVITKDNVPGEGWTSEWEKNDPERWIQIDLGKEKTIAKYIVYHAQSVFADRPHQNTKDFVMEYSLDGTDWKTCDTVTGNTEAKTVKVFEEPIQARYVKMQISEASQQPTETRARIAEIELFENADDVSIFDPVEDEITNVNKEVQDIKNAEVDTDMTIDGVDVSLNTWVSATENAMITEIQSEGDKDIALDVSVWTKAADAGEKHTQKSDINDEENYAWASRKTENLVPHNPKSWYSETAIMTKVLGEDDVTLEKTSDGSSSVKFDLKAGEKKYLVTTIGGGGQTYNNENQLNGTDPLIEANEVSDVLTTENQITDLKQEHQNWWKDYWNKSYINIGDEQYHNYYYRSLYYMGCTARADEMAPGLYGLWVTTDNPNWCGDFHLNYNYQAPFYGMYSSNRYEGAMALVDQILEYMEQGEINAKEKLSVIKEDYVNSRPELQDGIENGILYPCGLGPWGSVAIEKYMNQTLDAPFAATVLISYYNYSQDEDFLVNKAYPYLEKVANFFEQWCEKEDLGDGNYRYNLYDGPHETWWGKNSGVAIGAVQNVYETLVRNYDVLAAGRDDVTEEKLAVWKDLYEHMADVPVRDYTAGSFSGKVFALTEEGTVAIRPESASVELEFVHPGERLSFDSDPELLKIGRDTVTAKEAANKNIWSQINNTPKIFTQAIRLGYDSQYIMDKFRSANVEKMGMNGTIHDGSHGIEKAGGIEFINNMLLQSSNGIIKVFPNWTGKDASFTNLREKGAYLVSGKMAEGTVVDLSIVSETGKAVTIVNPWADKKVVVTDSEGNVVSHEVGTTVNSGEQTIKFAAKAGETYNIEKGADSKDDLAALIDYANSQKDSEDYKYVVPAVKKAFEKALAEAIAVHDNADVTQADVDAAYDNLLEMVQMLGFTGNSESLKTLADSARGMNPDLFTEESWAVLEDALAKTDAVLANENALQDEIDAARDALQDAMDGLVRVPVDKDALKKLIDKAQKYVDKIDQYTDGTAKIFTDVLKEATDMWANPDASQKMVDGAYASLQNAIFQLRLKPSKDKLDDLIKAAEKVDTSKYTDESAAAFKAALEDAKAVFADGEATKEEVKAAEKVLKEAQKNLVAKADVDNKGNDKVASNDGNSNTNSGAKSQPKTGDAATVWTMLLGCMAAVAAGTIIIRRKLFSC